MYGGRQLIQDKLIQDKSMVAYESLSSSQGRLMVAVPKGSNPEPRKVCQ